jgi:hypothetical protein
MAEGQRKRWAAVNAAKTETGAPKKKTAKATIAEVVVAMAGFTDALVERS